MLPNFIIVGAPKAGTTSLYHYLIEHPQVFMSNPKEVNFFSREEIQAQGLYYNSFSAKDLREYEKLFARVKYEKAIGEASVSYLFYPETPTKIKAVIPNVKIIILLRDPIERAFSHYLMDYKMGLIDIPFEQIVYKENCHKHRDLYYQQYIELGLYYEQVKRYFRIFNRNNIRIYVQDDLRANTKRVILDLYDFLGIDQTITPEIDREHNEFSMAKNGLVHMLYTSNSIRNLAVALLPKTIKEKMKRTFFDKKNKPKLEIETIDYLHSVYIHDIQKLENLIGIDLTHWCKGRNTT